MFVDRKTNSAPSDCIASPRRSSPSHPAAEEVGQMMVRRVIGVRLRFLGASLRHDYHQRIGTNFPLMAVVGDDKILVESPGRACITRKPCNAPSSAQALPITSATPSRSFFHSARRC